MARPASGNIEIVTLADGTISVRARFRHHGERRRVVLGRDVDGWTEARGRRELALILAQLRAGIPIDQVLARYAPEPEPEDADDEYGSGITMHEYASHWLERRRVGEIGDGPLAETTYQDYLWRLRKYILPFFGGIAVTSIDEMDCRRFRAKLFKDSDSLKMIAAAVDSVKGQSGLRRRPLSPRTIQMLMRLLGQVLGQAVKDNVREGNPARDPELKIRIPKPARTFLEIDQLVMLLDAAQELQSVPIPSPRAKLTREQAAEIRARLARGEMQYALRLEYGLGAGSMSMLAHGRTYTSANERIGWRALCAMLGDAGPRISETLAIRERDVRLHDPNGARLWIADSKTPTGVRYVEITPSLRDELLAYRADKVRYGYPTGPDVPLFCTRSGKRWSASNVRKRILAPTVKLASDRLIERGLPPLPHVTPHTLRRTYVSIMLLATNFDVTYVQHQVGHAESKMTLDVYAQLLDRRKRDHGVAFDALLADARRSLYGREEEGFGPPIGPPRADTPDPQLERFTETSSFAGASGARPGRFERPTSRSGGGFGNWRKAA
jgi:integrase